MRFAGIAVLCLATSAQAGGAIKSDPAFAGVSLNPLGGACVLGTAVEGGPAADADVHPGDVLVAIAGQSIGNCDDVVGAIGAHKPGDTVVFELLRGQGTETSPTVVDVKITLSTRSEVLARRVGQHLPVYDLQDVDGRTWSIDDRHGTPLVIGAFAVRCSDCSAFVDGVAAELAHRALAADVLAVTADPEGEPVTRERIAWLRHMTPLAVAEPQVYSSLATTDLDRVFFTVIDCSGVVRLVVPIAMDAEDAAASIDEIAASVEQAGHARRRR